jgi:hypothetical protein
MMPKKVCAGSWPACVYVFYVYVFCVLVHGQHVWACIMCMYFVCRFMASMCYVCIFCVLVHNQHVCACVMCFVCWFMASMCVRVLCVHVLCAGSWPACMCVCYVCMFCVLVHGQHACACFMCMCFVCWYMASMCACVLCAGSWPACVGVFYVYVFCVQVLGELFADGFHVAPLSPLRLQHTDHTDTKAARRQGEKIMCASSQYFKHLQFT